MNRKWKEPVQVCPSSVVLSSIYPCCKSDQFQQDQFSAEEKGETECSGSGAERGVLNQDIGKRERLSSDPEDYHHAKKTLKKAVLEHYRYVSHFNSVHILAG
jgi:hypothetical protein